MHFEKIDAPSRKDLFVEQMENLILSGKLKSGEQLPPERELAKTMQVSRSVVNAGIKEMAGKGFLEIQPRIGAFVGDYRRNGTVETLLSIMKYNGGHLRRDEIRALLEIKVVLDCLAVRLAIPILTEDKLEVLRPHLEALRGAKNADEAGVAAFAFYHGLAFISGNTLLPLMYYSFRVPVLSLWTRFSRKYGADSLYERAAKLYAAIEQRDVDRAVQRIEKTVGDALNGANEIYSE